MCKRQSNIAHFIEYFDDQITLIEATHPNLYRKILYATALDPLARAAYGKNQGHRQRITRLIDDLVDWEHKNRISLPQLSLTLEVKNLTSGVLYSEVQKRLADWQIGHILRLSNSPSDTELEPFAVGTEKSIIASSRYTELFYTYRNNLIHEFREPGHAIEMSSDGTDPYYHSMHNSPWQLVYPIGFFSSLYEKALEGLEKYLTANKIDPLEQFEFGSKW